MSEKSSSPELTSPSRTRVAGRVIGVIAWVVAGFVMSAVAVYLIAQLLVTVGVSFEGVNKTIINTVTAAVVYVLAAAIVIGGPQLWGRLLTTQRELGIDQPFKLRDLSLVPIAFIAYYVGSLLLITAVTALVPGFDIGQAQETGFADLTKTYEYILAFLTLVVLAPVAEELLFRGYLYGKLRRWVAIWAGALLTSVVFGAIHGQWNVGLDVFVLSFVMCGLREMTGSIWAGMLLHMLKNGLAFYLLFINPVFLHTIGG